MRLDGWQSVGPNGRIALYNKKLCSMSFQQVLARKTSSFVVNVLNVRHGILAPRRNVPPAQHKPQQKANIVEGGRLVVKQSLR